jgi:hypothetical protein
MLSVRVGHSSFSQRVRLFPQINACQQARAAPTAATESAVCKHLAFEKRWSCRARSSSGGPRDGIHSGYLHSAILALPCHGIGTRLAHP